MIQEEIREGIEKLVHQAMYATAKVGASRYSDVDASHDVKRIIEYLYSKGCVLKVEDTVPHDTTHCRMLALGYHKTEPLIKEE